jgi:hypothetical protein
MADSGLSFAIASGLNVIIQALPINSKVVLCPPPSDSQEDSPARDRQTVREASYRRKSARCDNQ